ncbi:MAG: cytochrome c biogenesis protein CcsA [Gammaproteobacteria bacterium]|nr:cytochrome c biogenesis protein CcsA [Gammaproteobacteria bacterium]
MFILLSVLSILCYTAAALVLIRRLRNVDVSSTSKTPALLLTIVALVLHAYALSSTIIVPEGLNLGFSNVSSMSSWFVASLLLIAAINKPIESLGVIILPVAAILLTAQILMPSSHVLADETRGLGIHILFSILAYSLLGLAAVQAMLLSVQEKHLHNRQPGGFIRALPPLESMEILLFQMITIGFTLQTMSLLSGFMYLENMFAQHIAHKTILSAIAWLVFAILLFGRWRYGWRGRTAVRWTLSGFVTLMIAYFGSKYVIEVLLER